MGKILKYTLYQMLLKYANKINAVTTVWFTHIHCSVFILERV